MGLDYTYGTTTNNGNVLSQTISAPSFSKIQNYTYDALNRLQQADEVGSWSQTYGYDQYGNRWVTPVSYIPDLILTPQSQLAFDPVTNRLIASQYDAAGNQTRDAATRTFTYDLENRQTTFNGTEATYSYDGEGRRVTKGPVGAQTIFVYNILGQLVAEYDALSGAGGTSYLTADHLGSTRVITDAGGAIKKRYDYLPFGEEIPDTKGDRYLVAGYSATNATRQKFTGKERDAESGLDYFGARYLSAAQGRFNSTDPIYIEGNRLADPQLLNLYSYVRNNPLNFTDPTGMLVNLNCQQVNAERCAQTVSDLNERQGSQFQVTRNEKTGQLNIVDPNKVDPTKLSNSERALYDAITNKDATGTLTVLPTDPGFNFERSTGKGNNSLDRSDLTVLNNTGNRHLSGEVISHAALESYASAKPGVTVAQAHNSAQLFGFVHGQEVVSGMKNTMVYGLRLDYRALRLGVDFRTRMTLKTPIPLVTLRKMKTYPPRDVTSVTILPEKK